jgi:predicted metal-dependent hydrolase
MATIEDKEFGTITVRRVSRSSSMRATVAPSGSLRLSVPSYAPLFMVKRMIASSRSELRRLLDTRPALRLSDGMSIGKSHTLLVKRGAATSVKRTGLHVIATLGPGDSSDDPVIVDMVRTQMRAILRKEAKAHLPKRIAYLAQQHGFTYSSLRFTHASSRWGSCNNKQAISLNIALMNLPFELMDYVLIHELAHTEHLNHSKDFWNEVERVDPDFRSHRTQLKQYNPAV